MKKFGKSLSSVWGGGIQSRDIVRYGIGFDMLCGVLK